MVSRIWVSSLVCIVLCSCLRSSDKQKGNRAAWENHWPACKAGGTQCVDDLLDRTVIAETGRCLKIVRPSGGSGRSLPPKTHAAPGAGAVGTWRASLASG